MRKSLHFLLAGVLCLGLAASAGAQTPFSGIVGDGGCTGAIVPGTAGGELYGFKITGSSVYNDMLFDLRQKGGTRTGTADVGSSGPAWAIPPNWREPEGPTDVVYSFITFPDGRLYVNSGQIGATGGALTAANVQMVGNSLPSAWGAGNGQDIVPTTNSGNLGIQFNFGPIAEVNPTEIVPNCHIAGLTGDPNTGAGLITGYNIYRVAAAAMPARADFVGNFQYFVPFTAGFDHSAGDDSIAGRDADSNMQADTRMASSADNMADDLVGLQNADAMPYTGDETVVFQDSAAEPGGARTIGTAPADLSGATTYWYAAQPVVGLGTGAALNGRTLTSANSITAETFDSDMDGMDDSARLDDTTAGTDFYSPQWAHGIPGYGLTANNLPLLSTPVQGVGDPLASIGDVNLRAVQTGSQIKLELSAALEGANVLGYNVLRGDARTRINDELILASGSEGNVYSLVDESGRSSRRTERSAVQYFVEIVHADGTPSREVGPFAVTTQQGRRSR